MNEIFKFYKVPDPLRIEKAVKFVKSYFGKVKGLNILDCGISEGSLGEILSKEGANFLGLMLIQEKLKERK